LVHVRKGLLHGVLSRLCRVIDRHAGLPVVSHVKLHSEGGVLRVEATNLSAHFTARIPCHGKITCCLPAKALCKFLKPEDATDHHTLVELLPKDDGKVTIAVEAATATMSALPVSDFPCRAGKKHVVWRVASTWRVSDFAVAVGWVCLAVGQEE